VKGSVLVRISDCADPFAFLGEVDKLEIRRERASDDLLSGRRQLLDGLAKDIPARRVTASVVDRRVSEVLDRLVRLGGGLCGEDVSHERAELAHVCPHVSIVQHHTTGTSVGLG